MGYICTLDNNLQGQFLFKTSQFLLYFSLQILASHIFNGAYQNFISHFIKGISPKENWFSFL